MDINSIIQELTEVLQNKSLSEIQGILKDYTGTFVIDWINEVDLDIIDVCIGDYIITIREQTTGTIPSGYIDLGKCVIASDFEYIGD